MTLILSKTIQVEQYIIWLRASTGWCVSNPLSREDTDLVCDNLDAQCREYRAVQCVVLESNQDNNNEFNPIRNTSIPEVLSCYRFSLGREMGDVVLVVKPN